MNKKYPAKIQKLIDAGEVIPQEVVFKSYSKKSQERILQKARYLIVAMELRKLRKALHFSQQKLARKMSVKREFISRIESGKQNVTLDTLYRVAEVTGKDLRFMFR